MIIIVWFSISSELNHPKPVLFHVFVENGVWRTKQLSNCLYSRTNIGMNVDRSIFFLSTLSIVVFDSILGISRHCDVSLLMLRCTIEAIRQFNVSTNYYYFINLCIYVLHIRMHTICCNLKYPEKIINMKNIFIF